MEFRLGRRLLFRPYIEKTQSKKKIDILLQWVPIELNESSVIIDAGCGGGYLSEYLSEKTGAKIKAFDQSLSAIELCKKREVFNQVEFICCNALELPYQSETADVIVCAGLLEHIPEYQKCIKELKRALKPEGYIYIVSSNRYSAMWFQWIWKKITHKWKYGYQKNWTPKQLERILDRHSIRKVKMGTLEGMGNFANLTKVDRFLDIGIVYVGGT